jgi:archaellum biogenesis ATPase FlaH
MGSLETMASIDERAYQAELDRRLAGMIAFGKMQPSLDVPYLIKGVIERGKLHVVYGPSGHGKTFLTIDLACHIAAGIEWRGRKVKQAPVVYIAAEAGESIQNRLMAWRDHVGDCDDIPLLVWPKASNVRDSIFRDRMKDILRAAQEKYGKLGLVIIDTFSRAMPGADENSAQHVTQAIHFADELRDEFGVAVLFVHHTGKNEDAGARGSSALKAALDYEIRVINKVAHLDKVRDGKTGTELPFDLKQIELGTDTDGDPLTSCVVEHLPDEIGKSQTLKPRKLPNSVIVAQTALTDAIREYGDRLPETSVIPPGVSGCKLVDFRRVFYRKHDNANADSTRKAYNRALQDLQGNQLAGVSDPYIWRL